jgi:hypothetical protein
MEEGFAPGPAAVRGLLDVGCGQRNGALALFGVPAAQLP